MSTAAAAATNAAALGRPEEDDTIAPAAVPEPSKPASQPHDDAELPPIGAHYVPPPPGSRIRDPLDELVMGVPTSRTIRAGEDGHIAWYDRTLLVPHEMLRVEMLRLQRMLRPEYFDPTVSWKVDLLFSYWQTYFVEVVHGHHDIEETIFFPAISERVALPPKLSADHRTLMRMLDEISGVEEQFRHAAGNDAQLRELAEELRRRVDEMCECMLEHLDEEEQCTPGMLRDHFDEAWEQRMVHRIVSEERRHSPQVMNRQLPMILAAMGKWGGPHVQHEMMKTLPPPARLFVRYKLVPADRRVHLGMFYAMGGDVPFHPPKGNCAVL